jgi:hypothetical protein
MRPKNLRQEGCAERNEQTREILSRQRLFSRIRNTLFSGARWLVSVIISDFHAALIGVRANFLDEWTDAAMPRFRQVVGCGRCSRWAIQRSVSLRPNEG